MYLGLDNKLDGCLSPTEVKVGQFMFSTGERQDRSRLLKEIFFEQADLSWLRQNTGAPSSGATSFKSIFQSSQERKGEAMGPLTQWVGRKRGFWRCKVVEIYLLQPAFRKVREKNNQQSKEVYKERRRHKTLALGDPPSEGSGRKSYDEDPEKLADDSRAAEPLGQTVMVT